MPLLPRQQRFCDRFLPGLEALIRNIDSGAGDFEGRDPELDTVGNDGVEGVAVRMKYTFVDRMSIEIRSRWRLRDGVPPYVPHVTPVDLADWERYSYSLHYGRSFIDVAFRIDLDSTYEYHLHFPQHDHVPAADCIPDTVEMDPYTFVAWVGKFRRDKIPPVKMKPGVHLRRKK
jgi:hypothetical protein